MIEDTIQEHKNLRSVLIETLEKRLAGMNQIEQNETQRIQKNRTKFLFGNNESANDFYKTIVNNQSIWGKKSQGFGASSDNRQLMNYASLTKISIKTNEKKFCKMVRVK